MLAAEVVAMAEIAHDDDDENPPDGCPWHFLESGETVYLDDGGGNMLPYSAALACESWHDHAAYARTALAAVDRAVVERLRRQRYGPRYGVLGVAFGGPAAP